MVRTNEMCVDQSLSRTRERRPRALGLSLALLLCALLPDARGEEKKTEEGGFVMADKVEFQKLVPAGAKVTKLAGDFKFTEGPVWFAGGSYLLFSDIPADEIKKWQNGKVTIFRKPSHNANGNNLDGQGNLLTCEHGSRTVTRTGADGKVETLADNYEGHKLNSPNDIVCRSDGSIWFTDPPYGLGKQKEELDGNYVFRLDPATRKLTIVASDFDHPNGLCFSPDEKKLYIADSGAPRHVRVFDVRPDDTLAGGAVFCKIEPGVPDGMRCDQDGRLWSTAGDGLHIFSPAGKLIGKIPVPETPANLCFGGPAGKTLYITARTSLYSIEVLVSGVRFAGK